MIKHISILRGINVGGKRRILMADLRILYNTLGFQNVITYIQSGNVIFDAKKSEDGAKITIKITQAIKNKYGFDVPVIVRSVAEIEKIIKTNPFQNKQGVEISNLHLTFLDKIPTDSNVDKIKDIKYPPNEYELIGKDVFLFCPGKYSSSKFTNNFFENKLKVPATTRNWKTVKKLLELASDE